MGEEGETNRRAEAPEPAPQPRGPVPRMYRVMKADGKRPALGASAMTLGVRSGKDIEPDGDGQVRAGSGGMSVRPRLLDVPAMFLPPRLRHLNRNAGGNNSSVVWRLGDGPFASAPVSTDLSLRPDAPNHGVVEPTGPLSFDAYQAALWATRDQWVNGEG